MFKHNTRYTFATVVVLALILTAPLIYPNGDGYIDTTLPALTGKYDIAVANLGSLNARGRTTSLVKLPSDATIVAAYTYASGFSDLTRDQLGDIDISFRNRTDNSTTNATASLIGYEEVDGLNYFTYRADVTAVVSAGTKTYRLNGFTLPAMPQQKAGFHGVALVVVYEQENLPLADIYIADGLDFFAAAKEKTTTDVTLFGVTATGFDQAASVKLFAAQGGAMSSGWSNNESEDENSAGLANGIWYATGSSAPPVSLMDAAGAVDYDNSSNADPTVDTDPLYSLSSFGVPNKWATVELAVPLGGSDTWVALELESQSDKTGYTPYEGVWTMAALRVVLESVGCGSIGDLVFYDRDGDGQQTTGSLMPRTNERGIPGVTVRLYEDNGNGIFNAADDALLDTVLTNELGYYEFRYLDKGTFFLEIDHERMNSQYIYFTNISNPTDAIILDDCTPHLDVDFGVGLTGLPNGGTGGLGGGNNGGGNFDFGNFDFSNFNFGNGGGFNFGGGGFFGGFGQALPVELSDFKVLEANECVKVAYLAVDSEESQFQVYRSTFRYENYLPVVVHMEKTSVEDQLVFTDSNVEPGAQYYYHIVEIDERGDRIMHGPVGVQVSGVPEQYGLQDAYPNPFNPTTKIHYQLPAAGHVSLEIYNMMGQKVKTLLAGAQNAGTHVINWDGTNDSGELVSAGTYVYRIKAGEFEASKTITFLK
ncbi:T9SS C-terminal target domain-containing protein [candidate division KSB1 bacterium]|nr:T9SS type A sorting domain-containing protein [candidate division KSB1 bacterium]RQW07197.1 MAG: T9SS C-terminal target domain-containing protein [candidate division KSB1 bacterium]